MGHPPCWVEKYPDLPILIFGAVRSRRVGFGVNVEYATALRSGFSSAPVCTSRHRINWNLGKELNLLAMRIHGTLHKSFKVWRIILASDGGHDLSTVGHAMIMVNRVTH